MNAYDDDVAVPAYFTVPMAPPRRQPVLDRAAGIWARVEFAGEAVTALHLGSGVPEPVGQGLVAGIAFGPAATTLASCPVLPGSGVKGALRVVFEAVTFACDPLDRDERCRSVAQVCPACALFGMGGLRGALAVPEVSVDGETAVTHVRQRYSHEDAPRRGRRLYGLEPEVSTAAAEEALLVVEAGARLVGSLAISGAEAWAVGTLALVTGLLPEGLPVLRLGGGKNRGLGVARLRLTAGSYASSQRSWLLGDRHELTAAVLSGWVDGGRASGRLRTDQLRRIREAYSHDA